MLARFELPSGIYHSRHNVTLRTLDGTTQIDHIIVSRFGIFVVETKNMKGWIFGDEKQASWTQKIYKNTFKFQNPLRQNYKHLKVLESALEVPSEYLHSVVVFVGDCSFKTKVPANVVRGRGYIEYIKSFRRFVFADGKVKNILDVLDRKRFKPSMATHNQHIRNIKSRSDVNAKSICPKCGNALVLHSVKRGARSGSKFWGCSSFPACRLTQEIDYYVSILRRVF